MHRFFIPPEIVAQTTPEITGSDANHIKRVVRLKPGDEIELFDGTGLIYTAQIVTVTPKKIQVTILQKIPAKTESRLEMVVAQAMLKEKKMDRLVRQLTELGIARWIPFTSQRTVPIPKPERLAKRITRWETISKESLKQCRRGKLPQIDGLWSYQEIIKMGAHFDLAIVFWENEAVALKEALIDVPEPQSLLAVFGPEGGFTGPEIKMAHAGGFITAGMGPRILRAETATVAGATLLQYRFGDMGLKKS
jgi:16S rRNA (uracil1498-N3)-methyltransferase